MQKHLTCRARLIVSLWVLGRCFAFFTFRDQLVVQKNICCGLRKVVAKSGARVYFEQQMLALLLIFCQTHNLSHNKFARVARQVEGFCISYFDAFRESDLIIRLYSLCKTGSKFYLSELFPSHQLMYSTNAQRKRSQVQGSSWIYHWQTFYAVGLTWIRYIRTETGGCPMRAAMTTHTVTPLQERGLLPEQRPKL